MEYQRVLLTGVAGFICSNLACYLAQKYPRIHFLGIDKMSYCSSLKNLDEIINSPNFTFRKLDFTQLDEMKKLFQEFHPDLVLHLGAYTHVDMSFNDSLIYTHNNVIGTHVLLECAREYPVKLFYFQSTDEVVGSKSTISDENSVMDPSNPYSSTKASAELLARSYYHSFKIPLIIARGNNALGPKQFPEKVVPKFISRLERGLPLQIQGTGHQCRSFIYISDFVEAIELIVIKGKIGEIYNIGSRDEISILQLASKLSQMYRKAEKIEYISDRAFNDQRYMIDSKLLSSLGFVQKISLDEGIRLTIKWYRDHPNHWTPEQLSLTEK